MTSEHLVEFAWGLANCGYDFLWVVRNDLVQGDAAVLPPEFLEATKGRCFLASWCEQEAVLRHETVGIFLTHYGWNSMMEVGDDVRREVVEERIREVMGGGEVGREMRRKAMEWKEIAVRATTQPGGRSLANLEVLLKNIRAPPLDHPSPAIM
ncbi:unnamed protein product [Triticum turgidum subsp. durum]|uniref:Glycosyltransferase n=1 Tax=Triticum turgidum subsp. durum TaxID=4567 RepID=A0A9R1PBL5_TRITD|nr:unnamed protein product [Triticum turgidum subsp. durum]